MALRDELEAAHAELTDGSPTAPLAMFRLALTPITRLVRRSHPRLDEHDAHDLATDAILAHVTDPGRYDPARGSLWSYLCRAALADATDLGRKRARRAELLREIEDDVEFWAARAKDFLNSDDTIDAERIMRLYGNRLVTSEAEAALLALMLVDERATGPYAEVLGMSAGDPAAETEVKRAKDRIKLRLKRLRDEF